jgi:hypothetical protein
MYKNVTSVGTTHTLTAYEANMTVNVIPTNRYSDITCSATFTYITPPATPKSASGSPELPCGCDAQSIPCDGICKTNQNETYNEQITCFTAKSTTKSPCGAIISSEITDLLFTGEHCNVAGVYSGPAVEAKNTCPLNGSKFAESKYLAVLAPLGLIPDGDMWSVVSGEPTVCAYTTLSYPYKTGNYLVSCNSNYKYYCIK